MNEKIEEYVKNVTRKLTCSKEEQLNVRDEMRDHLYSAFDTFVAKGLTEEVAASKAINTFGDMTLMQESFQLIVDPLYGWLRKLAWIGFIFYSFIVLWVVLIQRTIVRVYSYFFNGDAYNPYISLPYENEKFFDFTWWASNINFIPFQTIYFYGTGSQYVNFDIIVNNLAGNMFLLLPLGLLLPFLARKFQKISSIVAIAFVVSFSVEVIQFTLQIGRADIDDVILNTIGALIGFGIYKIIRWLLTIRFRLSNNKRQLI